MTLEEVEATGSNEPSKAKIFISYSRKDIAFADRLDAGLKARGSGYAHGPHRNLCA